MLKKVLLLGEFLNVGIKNPDCLLTAMNLCSALSGHNDVEAKKLLLQTLSTAKRVLGEQHPHVQSCSEMLNELNEKYVKVGKSKKDGWLRKVLKLPWCQVKQKAVISPGRETTMKSKIEKKMKFVGLFSERYVKRNIDLPNRVKRHARKMRMKRIVRKPQEADHLAGLPPQPLPPGKG